MRAMVLPAALELVPTTGLDAEATIPMAWSSKANTGLLRQFRNHPPPFLIAASYRTIPQVYLRNAAIA